MSRRYMDFVPARSVDKRTAVVSGAPRRTNVTATTRVAATRTVSVTKPRVVMPEPTATPRTRMVRRDVSRRVVTQKAVAQPSIAAQRRAVVTSMATVSPKSTSNFAIREDAKLGEIEDLSPKFVKMDVPKRPLSDGSARKVTVQPEVKAEAKEVKSKRLIGRFKNKAAKSEAKGNVKTASKAEKKTTEKNTFVAPKPTFINQDKVAKRPLSKNVYQKNIVATNESKNKAPVAIIAKPEKESKVGLVVAIILTIILGAVAGTIAFLLLPK